MFKHQETTVASWIQKLLYSSRAVQETVLQYLQGMMKDKADTSIERMIDDLTQTEQKTRSEKTLAPLSKSESFNLSSDSWHQSEEFSLQDEDTDYDLAYQRLQAKDGEFRYTRGSFVAYGGFSHVWRIQDHYLHRTIVSKVLSDTSIESKVQFIREAQICAQLQHNGVIPLYDVVEKSNGEIHLLMREIRGNSLYDVIQQLPHQQATFDLEEANRALHQIIGQFIQVCQTISYAHARGVAHLDLKPANIMVGFFGETFIIDWGISRPTPPVSEHSEIDSPVFFDPELEQNIDFGVIGTPFYMSPEQIENQGIDHRADIYALGCILIHILFSRSHLPSGVNLLLAKREKSFSLIPKEDKPCFITPQNSIYNFQQLLKICQKSTKYEPKKRYQTVRELIQELELWINGEQRRSKARQHLENIQSHSKQINILNHQIEVAYTEHGGDLVQRFLDIQKLKHIQEKTSFTLRQEYQKAIFYVVEDIQKIEDFVSMELKTYWDFVRSKDWKIARRIFTQMELYIDLLPQENQVEWKDKIDRLQNMDDLHVRGTLIPRLEQMVRFQKKMQKYNFILLVGPAGVGKTHFAKEYCSKRAFIGKKHCFVDVQNCFDSTDVALKIQQEIPFESDRVLSLLEIAEKINERQQDIIVLDNCEQLSEEAELGIQDFIHTLNDCRVILTSRKKHNLQRVHLYSLASMTPLESIELFVESLSRGTQELRLEDIKEIFKLAKLVDYHPLSIELIAQHARKIPISELKTYLSEKFLLLRGNISDGTYGSLWETLDWSWNLLTDKAQRLLIELIEWRGVIFQVDLLTVHPFLQNLDILHALSELEDLHFLSSDTLYEQPTYSISQSIKDFVYQKREEKEYTYLSAFQESFYSYFAHFFDSISDWNQREARVQMLLHIIGKEDLDLHIRQLCLLNIYSLNSVYGPYNRGFEWLSLFTKGDEIIRLKLFSKVFFLGQRLDFPSEFHQNIFDNVDKLQVKEKAPKEWFHFQQMKLRYCHLYGALPPHKIQNLIQEIQNDITTSFATADTSIKNQIESKFDQSMFLYEKETLNHYFSAQKRIEHFQPQNDQERYMKHATLANLYMSLGRFSESLREYDESYRYVEKSKNRNQICTYYRNKGLTYYVMRKFEDSHRMFTLSLQLSEELQSVEAIQFNKNLLSILEFEKTGTVPNFELQRGVPLIQNFLLAHSTAQNVEKIFLAGEFVQKHRIHPSLTFLRIYLMTGIQLLIDFDIPFNKSSACSLFQNHMVTPEENPLDHVKDVLLLSTLWCHEKKYTKALKLVEKALTLELGESVEDTVSLEAERVYLLVHLEQKIEVDLLRLSIPTICYSNQKLMITAIINLCIASYTCGVTEQARLYMNMIHELYGKYPFTHLHCTRIQEIQQYAVNVNLSKFRSDLFHNNLTEKRVIEMMDKMIQLSSET